MDFKKGAVVAVKLKGRRRALMMLMLRPRELESLAVNG